MDLLSSQAEKLGNHVKNIAKRHAKQIGKAAQNNPVSKYEFNIVPEAKKVVGLHFFHDIDNATLQKEIETLDASLQQMICSNVLVEDQDSKRLVPPPYEVISLILSSTNEQYHQQYFHLHMDEYYQELCKNTNQEVVEIINSYTKADFDQQVKLLLPCVKIKTAHKLIEKNDDESKKLLKELASNIVLFFKNPKLNLEDIYVVAYNRLNCNNFKVVSYELVPLDARNGFLGDYFNLKIIVEFENSELEFTLFAKFMTPRLESIKEVAVAGPSKKEEFFYTHYLPLLEKHGLESIIDFCPKCYFSRINDVLILENMALLGFTALAPNDKLEIDSLRSTLRQMAKFHASSMLLEEVLSSKEGKIVDLDSLYNEYFEENVFDPNGSEFVQGILGAFVERTLYAAQQFPELIQNISLDKLREKIISGWKLNFQQITKSEELRNAICHGDMHVANVLYRLKDGLCEDTSLIDFQMLRYCPPVHDLLFFIYQNSFKDTRDKYYEQLIEEYYSHVSTHLKSFNYDPAEVYPEEKFKESVEYMKSQALFQALYYAPFSALEHATRERIFGDSDLVDKYFNNDKTSAIDLGMEDAKYRRVMYELIADLVEYCNDS